jgi:hypothetical protein
MDAPGRLGESGCSQRYVPSARPMSTCPNSLLRSTSPSFFRPSRFCRSLSMSSRKPIAPIHVVTASAIMT